MQQQISCEEKQLAVRKPYQAPELTQLGSVEEMTQVMGLGSGMPHTD